MGEVRGAAAAWWRWKGQGREMGRGETGEWPWGRNISIWLLILSRKRGLRVYMYRGSIGEVSQKYCEFFSFFEKSEFRGYCQDTHRAVSISDTVSNIDTPILGSIGATQVTSILYKTCFVVSRGTKKK